MKKLILTVFAIAFVTQFTASGKTLAPDSNKRSEKKLARQEKVREAVESKSFAVELDRLYMYRYGSVNLTPGRNFIIINGNQTAIRAAYAGRQRGMTPVAGINLKARPSVYKIEKNENKGSYKIVMEVTQGSDTFHVIMTISENGNCSAQISGVKIDNTRYSGRLVLTEKRNTVPEPDAIKI